MKTYTGKLNAGGVGGQVIMVDEDGTRRQHSPYPLPHIVRHSPDGFNWGYSGSGPADTALSILTDCVGRDVANAFYQKFKSEFVASWGDSFEITEKEIKDWLLLITKDEKY
ncbi:unnamed protein product [marine sediment metagenome]|uniref:Uncharacterized protein n=1 Tax=marine sediment metagenome TaxID=412755 RepID=X1NIF7_9ZZZZ